MKILHTADLHLGHQLFGYDREDEQRDMVNKIAAVVKDEQPDVMIIAGDIFNVAQPSASSQHILVDGLLKFKESCPSMEIVAIAGNHDSASRHEIFRKPWLDFGIYAVGTIDRDDDIYSKHIIKIKDKGYVIAVPYCYERNIPADFYRTLVDKVSALNDDNLPVVIAAHTTVSGCDYSGHDRATDITVGGVDSVPLEMFGVGFDYLALGHIHRCQDLRLTAGAARYSGTPLAVSFDEAYRHSVSIVEIESHYAILDVRSVEIEPLRHLVTIPGRGYKPWPEVLDLFKQYDDSSDAYIRLNILADGSMPIDLDNQARLIAETKKCRYCYTNIQRKSTASTAADVALTVSELKSQDPIDFAERYFKFKSVEFGEDLKELFHTAVKSLNKDDNSAE
jgi:exonuclease SbcD